MVLKVETPEANKRKANSNLYFEQVDDKISQPISTSMHAANHLHVFKAFYSLLGQLTTNRSHKHSVGDCSHKNNHSSVTLALPFLNFVGDREGGVP